MILLVLGILFTSIVTAVLAHILLENKISHKRNRGILFVIAAHTNNNIREAALRSIFDEIKHHDDLDVVVIQSGDRTIRDTGVNAKYRYVENNIAVADFGKYKFALDHEYLEGHEAVILTNDSCLWVNPIDDFIQMMKDDKFETEHYGYVESNQTRKHYQSMLRGFSRSGIEKLQSHMKKELHTVKDRHDLINIFEVNGGDIFKTRKALHLTDGDSDRHFDDTQISTDIQNGYALLKLKAISKPEELQLPPKHLFNGKEYIELNADLCRIPEDKAWDHYVKHGRKEGRVYKKSQTGKIKPNVDEICKKYPWYPKLISDS